MREFGLIDHIIEIIYFYTQVFLYDGNKEINFFMESLYELLRMSIQEYRPNELYAS